MLSSNRTHQIRISKLHVFIITIIPCLLLGFFFIIYFSSPTSNSTEDNWFEFLFPYFLLLWVVGYWSYAYFYRITLGRGFLEIKTLFGHKKIAIEELSSFKIDNLGIHIFLKSKPNSPYLIITPQLDDHYLFITWLEQYCSNPEWEAQQQNYENEVRKVLENDAYGKNKIEKEENLATVHKIIKWCNRVTFLNLIWAFLGTLGLLPWVEISYSIAIATPLFLLYFSIRYKDFFTITDPIKASPFPDIGASLSLPSFSISCPWLFSDLYLYDIKQVWLYALLISILLTIPILFAAKDIRYNKIESYFSSTFFILIMLCYGFGVLTLFNLYFDNSKSQKFTAKVVKKEKGKSDDSSHHLTLTPWHTQKEPTYIEVSLALLDAVKTGEEVDIYFKEGSLGFPYYAVYPKE